MKNFKPMLAVDFGSVENIRFPCFVSPKLDGIRAINIPGIGLRTRSLKEIPNAHVRSLFDREEYSGLDGEFIFGDPTAPDVFNKTTSAIMSRDGTPDVTFHVFDNIKFGADVEFEARYQSLLKFGAADLPGVSIVPHTLIRDADQLLMHESGFVTLGYEGAMLRSLRGPYKFGRSTLRENFLLKVKRFEDFEAEVIGVEELMTNNNEQIRDERGYAKRSTAKEGLTPTGTLGALICKSPNFTCTFNVGSGFTMTQRADLWKKRKSLIGHLAVVKYQSAGSAAERPRLPIWKGWRHPLDL